MPDISKIKVPGQTTPYDIVDTGARDLIALLRQLPAVTSADNGKILMVVNGQWSVQEIEKIEG